MASLALGLAGAAVGSFFGPLGTSIGWGLGAAIGGRLGAKGTEGPRLTDLRAQNSAYGVPIPIGYGTIRVAGNVIWATDLVEHKKKSGGKGGPKVTTYSYTASFAVGLLETSFLQDGALVNNPIVGILRIWADSRLLYGEGSESTVLPMTLYLGTEDQEADPTIEAEEGAGNVSAHRGMAYVVFTDLELGSFGNRIPNLQFEIVATGAIRLELYAQWPVDFDYPVNGSTYSYPYIFNGTERLNAEQLALHRYRSGNDYGAVMGTGDSNVLYYDRKIYDLKGNFVSADAQIATAFGGNVHVLGSLNSGIAYVTWQDSLDCSALGGGPFTITNHFAWVKDGVVTYTKDAIAMCLLAVQDIFLTWTSDFQLPINTAPVYWNGFVFAAGATLFGTSDVFIRRWPAPDGACYTPDFDPVAFNADAVRTGYPTSLEIADAGDIIIGDDGFLYWLVGYYSGTNDGTRLFKLDQDLNLVKTWWTGSGATLPAAGLGSSTIYRGHIIGWHELSPGNYYFTMERLNADGSTTFVAQLASPAPAPAANPITPVHYIGGGLAAFRGGILKLGSDGVPWGDIVANVSQHMGYADTEYDVSELTDITRGYTVGNRMTGRAAIEAGMPAYQHGAVESNLTAKFPKWGGNVVATVTATDLGARSGDSDPVDPLEITHLDDKQIPQRIETVFLNLAMDYQEGTQYAARTESASDFNAAVTIPIVLTDAEAKKMADVLLYNAWIERDKFKFSLPRKWSHLEPTDVINIDGNAVRITNKDEQGYTHIAFEGVATRVGVFINGPVAVPPIGFVPQVPPTLNRTDLLLLDIPLVADTDFPNGHYAAIAGRMAGAWPGAGLFKSIDGGVNYDSIYSTVEPDTFGVATTVLADWAGGNVFDESNTVTVRLTPGSGELASSNELGVLNGANRAMLGDEMIAFKTATLIAARTYTLSGLLRGRRGTEWATGDHAVEEAFVLLPAHNIEGAFAELGQLRQYKAVTSGGLLSSATAVDFTNTGVALKEYAPALLGGGRNGAGDITLQWTPRARRHGGWLDNADVPAADLPQDFRIIVYTDSTYTTEKFEDAALGATSYAYPAATQTADFGSPQSTLYWDVAPYGSNGAGYSARGVT